MAEIHHILALYATCLYVIGEFYLKVKSATSDPDDIMATFITQSL